MSKTKRTYKKIIADCRIAMIQYFKENIFRRNQNLTCDQNIWADSLRTHCNWLHLNESILDHNPSLVSNKYSDVQINFGLKIACCRKTF